MTTYSLTGYGNMLSCAVRMPAYLEALRRCIRPGSVVLDLGAGFGYFSLIACRLGASRVYAIEPARSVNQLPELARLNGFADRIVSICDKSTKVTLPEKVDVIVADIRGTVPMLNGSLHTMIDARDRFLAKGGTLLPWRDRLMIAPVESRSTWVSVLEPWLTSLHNHELTAGLNLGPVREQLLHAWGGREINPQSLLAPAKAWAEIDYHTNTSVDVEGRAEFTVSQPGTLHGWGSWFEAELMQGIRYSTGPDALPTVYGSAFLPLPTPLLLQQGDRIEVSIAANSVAGDYHLRWRTKQYRESKQLASFDQGDFFAHALDLERLKQRLPTHAPALKPEGQLARVIIEGAHAGRTIGEIADGVLEAFPGRFENRVQAIDYAAHLFDRINS